MTLVEIILSIITISISLIALIFSMINANKINRINLRINYFDIFKSDLLEKIPMYYTSFITNESYIANDSIGKDFEDYINNLRIKIKFLNFIDEKNYKLLDRKLIELEEKIILLPTKLEDKDKYIKKIEINIKDIYKKINKHFT